MCEKSKCCFRFEEVEKQQLHDLESEKRFMDRQRSMQSDMEVKLAEIQTYIGGLPEGVKHFEISKYVSLDRRNTFEGATNLQLSVHRGEFSIVLDKGMRYHEIEIAHTFMFPKT